LPAGPAGRWLASGGNDRTVRVWRVSDGAARSCRWLPATEPAGLIVACSAGLYRYDFVTGGFVP
jgi:WD40 repeat protein